MCKSIFLFLLISLNIFPQIFEKEFSPGIIATINSDYNNAFRYWNRKIEENPESVEWYFLKALTIFIQIEDTGNYFLKDKSLEIIKTVLKKTEYGNKDYRNCLYRGIAFGYRGAIKIKTGNLFGGILDGIKSSSQLKKCIELKKDIPEPYIFLGIQKYWKGKYLSSIKWFPAFKDEREEGINLIKSHLIKDSFLYYFNANQLIWIYIDYRKYNDAIVLIEKCLEDFPESRFFLYPLAEAYERKGNYHLAIVFYKKIMESIEKDNLNKEYCWFKINLKIAENYFKLKQFLESIEYLNRIFNSEFYTYSFYGREKIIKKGLELKKAINKLKK